jgi:formate dehydrogenase iron-sulfur subunit
MSYAILTDTTLCTGCDKCVDACVEINHLGEDLHYRWREADGLNENRFCSVVRPVPDCFVRLQCRQCLDPACASACPVGALQKTDAGPVIYDTEICMGCRYCMMACPFGIPRYEWESAVPHIRKCTFCYEAMAKGEIEQPACTAACPERATVFFEDRGEALLEARRRIAENPGAYFEDRIWGEHEVGGTSVLYLASTDLSAVLWHSFKPLGDEPFPERTERIMVTVPSTFFGVCMAMAGTYWVIRRRQKLMSGNPPADDLDTLEGGEP